MVNFTPGTSLPHPLNRMGGTQSQPGQYGEVTILDPTGTLNSNSSVVQPIASCYNDCGALVLIIREICSYLTRPQLPFLLLSE
jgi:hypothetical protein